MIEEAFNSLFGIFFSEATMLAYPTIFDTIKIVFIICLLIFLFFGLASVGKTR